MPQETGGASDWKFMSAFGEEMAKKFGVATEDVWKTLINGNIPTGSEEDGGSKFTFSEEDMPGFGEKLKKWISEHPIEIATLLACIVVGPTAVVMTPALLGLLGFTPLGVAAGMLSCFDDFI